MRGWWRGAGATHHAARPGTLRAVRRARERGFSLVEVRELLALAEDRDQPCGAVDAVASSHLATIERKIADLSQMRDELARVIGGCRLGKVGDCKIIQTLEPLRGASRR